MDAERAHVTVIVHNERSNTMEVGGEPLLLRGFAKGDDWSGFASGLPDRLDALGDVEIEFVGSGIRPADYDPEDPDQDESAEWLSLVISYRGDREPEIRRAVQEVLNDHGFPTCTALWSGSGRTGVIRGDGLVIATIGDLYRAEGCENREELDQQVDDNVAGAGRIDWTQSDAGRLVIRIDECVEALALPFTIGSFWATVVRLDEARGGAAGPSSVCRPHWRHREVCRSAGGLPCSCGCIGGTRWCVEAEGCPTCHHPYRYHLDGACWWNDACTCAAVGRTLDSPDRYLAELDQSAMLDRW